MNTAFSHDPASLLLFRLQGVRKSGKGWTARCPAHEDRTASLSVVEGNDGRVLLHCFAGCAAVDVIAAVGLQVADLFPQRERGDLSPMEQALRREAAQAAQVKAAANVLGFEASIVLIAAREVLAASDTVLSPDDCERLAVAHDCAQAVRATLQGGSLKPKDYAALVPALQRGALLAAVEETRLEAQRRHG